MKVVFIAGKKRSGKDTFATFLSDILQQRNFNVKTYHLADELKSYVSRLLGVNLVDLEKYKNTNTYVNDKVTYRQVLQTFGDIAKELTDKTIWSKLLRDKINKDNSEFVKLNGKLPDYILIPDYRYSYEADLFNDLDCKFVKVVRQGLTDTDYHLSEVAFDNIAFPYEVINDGSLEDLYDKAAKFSREIK